jgi:mono/diheme cytochrome c family protein
LRRIKALCRAPSQAVPRAPFGAEDILMRAPSLVLLLLLAAGPAPAAGPVTAERVAEGRRIAETWCANCHVIGPAARGPVGDAAPPFQEIAAMPSTTAMSLRAFLTTPHGRMPDYRLSNDQIEAASAYILSLKRP